jgi:shikimate kinase
MSVVLIGARGSGKSTIGRKLADRLWQSFIDVDEQIIRRAGKTIRDIFEQDGEERFRELEIDVIREAAALPDQVIALGGGSLMREENRNALREAGHQLFYLRCDPNELARRIKADPTSGATRPNLTQFGGGIEEIKFLLAIREAIYRECMHAEVDVTKLSPEEAVVSIVNLMQA